MRNCIIRGGDYVAYFESCGADSLFITFSDLHPKPGESFGGEVIKSLGSDHLAFEAQSGNRYQNLSVADFFCVLESLNHNYKYFYFYGFSSGAHAAIYFSSFMRSQNFITLALSPNNPLHPINSDVLSDVDFPEPNYQFTNDFVPKNSIIIYDNLHFLDNRFVNSIYQSTENCFFYKLSGGGHGLLQLLIETRVIKPILGAIFCKPGLEGPSFSILFNEIMNFLSLAKTSLKNSVLFNYNFCEKLFLRKKYSTIQKIYKLRILPIMGNILDINLLAALCDRYSSVCYKLGEIDHALAFSKKAVELAPNIKGYKAFQIELLTNLNFLKEAGDLLDICLSEDDYYLYHHRASVLYMKQGRKDLALASGRRSIELAPNLQWLSNFLSSLEK